MAVTPQKPLRNFPALTGVRFFAALAVLLFHYGAGFSARLGAPVFISNILRNGMLGVTLFYVLSGFIVSHAHHGFVPTRDALVRFYLGRVARIYPVYLLALVLACIAPIAVLTVPEAIKVLTLVQSWTPPEASTGYLWITQAWSLSTEWFFYLVFPFLWYGMRQMSSGANLALLLVLSIAIVGLGTAAIAPGVVVPPLVGHGVSLWIPSYRITEFLFGICLYRAFAARTFTLGRHGSSLAECGVAFLMLAVMATAASSQAQSVFSLLAGLLIILLAQGQGILSKGLSSRGIVLLGGASYGIYIFQGPVRKICAKFLPTPFDQVLSPLATITLSIAVFLYFEKPARTWILRLYPTHRPNGA